MLNGAKVLSECLTCLQMFTEWGLDSQTSCNRVGDEFRKNKLYLSNCLYRVALYLFSLRESSKVLVVFFGKNLN